MTGLCWVGTELGLRRVAVAEAEAIVGTRGKVYECEEEFCKNVLGVLDFRRVSLSSYPVCTVLDDIDKRYGRSKSNNGVSLF